MGKVDEEARGRVGMMFVVGPFGLWLGCVGG